MAGWDVVRVNGGIYDLPNDPALRQKVGYLNRSKVDVAVELHLNGGQGTYSTAIYWDDAEKGVHSNQGKQLADQFKLILPWQSRGARPMSWFDRGGLYFLEKTKMPAIIVEPGFRDTPAHKAFWEKRNGPVLYATMVYQGLELYAREVLA
jgi:N-acetylmuramoyl-L-alanine amidase